MCVYVCVHTHTHTHTHTHIYINKLYFTITSAPFFMLVWIAAWYHFLSAWRNFFSICCKAGRLLAVNSLNVYLFENVFILPSFLKYGFATYSTLGWVSLPALWMSFNCLLASIASDYKLAVNLFWFSGMQWVFSPTISNIFSVALRSDSSLCRPMIKVIIKLIFKDWDCWACVLNKLCQLSSCDQDSFQFSLGQNGLLSQPDCWRLKMFIHYLFIFPLSINQPISDE